MQVRDAGAAVAFLVEVVVQVARDGLQEDTRDGDDAEDGVVGAQVGVAPGHVEAQGEAGGGHQQGEDLQGDVQREAEARGREAQGDGAEGEEGCEGEGLCIEVFLSELMQSR